MRRRGRTSRTGLAESAGGKGGALVQGLKALGIGRLAALGGIGAGMLALLMWIALAPARPSLALLYGDLDMRDSARIVAELERLRIPHEIRAQGAQLLVPAEQVTRLRMSLAQSGLPSGGSVGYEIFDRTDGLTATGFQQQINHLRALEGELARTIQNLSGVRAARVHLVMPRREPFSRERAEASASVVITMAGAQRLDREQVASVMHLVAAAVPGLRPQAISIVDQRGTLLARGGRPTEGASGGGQTPDELRRAFEMRLSRAVEEMLERVVGPGRARVEVAAEMEFDRVTTNDERFDPDGQVVRSTQNVTEQNRTIEREGNVSVANNLPNAGAAAEGSAPGQQENRTEETVNYEISRSVRTVVQEGPRLKRISVAVLVDGVADRAPDGSTAWRERSAEDIAKLVSLVRSAVGYDEARGDKLDVVSLRFAAPDAPEVPAATGWLAMLGLDPAALPGLAQSAIWALVALLGLLFVVRPLASRVIARLLPPEQGAATLLPPGAMGAAQLPGPVGAAAIPGAEGAPGPMLQGMAAPAFARPEAMVDLGNVEGQVRASTINRIVSLVDKHPEEALSIIRGWLAREA
ncbi:MAG: flagellar M-ring protein FliF [Alphaproteobacteria bacterium]|nr:flagellar M-ring protein FliF [Alphaproteobacteria bacterium]